MKLRDFLLLGLLLLWLIAVALYLYKKKKEGKCMSCCGGNCASCGQKRQK